MNGIKLSYILTWLLLLFSVSASAREYTQQELDQIFRDAKQGNHKAQAYLASMYYNGKGLAVDHERAAHWFLKAAKQGNAFAQDSLGRLFERGEGVEQDFAEAVSWYRKAADQGHSRGQLALGIMLYRGNGVAQDFEEAEKWFRRATDRGQPHAEEWLDFIKKKRKQSTPDGGWQEGIRIIFWLLIFFPFWGLAAFSFVSYSPWQVAAFLLVVIIGGGISLFVAFVSNGGAGGSVQLSSSGWGGMIFSLVIEYLILFSILVAKEKPTNQLNQQEEDVS
ncbi:MAG: tetratricopeptide repeat protein [Candidatus Electrothrix gigas]